MPPLVSVVIPTYNRSALLVEAIESVLGQTWQDIEVIVVDDGSTDDTQPVLAPYRARIKYIFQPNSGRPARARNVGTLNASGELIAFLDSDDVMLPRKIETQARFLQSHPDVGMVVSDFSSFANGKTLSMSFTSSGHPRFLKLPKTLVGPKEYILSREACDCLALDNFVGTSSVVVRREVFQQVGLFDESLDIRPSEDVDMWFRIAERFPLGYVDLVLHAYRVHEGNISSWTENVIRARIGTREKFLKSSVISIKTRGQLRTRLGEFYVALAEVQLNEGRLVEARFSLWQSMKRRPLQLAAYKLLCDSLLPFRLRGRLHRLYSAVRRDASALRMTHS